MNDTVFEKFFGARKETILRFQQLYGEDYFSDVCSNNARAKMYLQEFTRLKRYVDNMEAGGAVLDIGCGKGDFLSLFGSQWKKYGIEISDFARTEAKKRGIITEFELKDNFFDIIIFRGTIQHIPDPIHRIGECYYWLKQNGMIVFLATPNINSIYYKIFNTLPMLDEPRNFLLPSDIILKQILINFGFTIKGIEYPYLGTPYARPFRDIFYFFLKFLGIRKDINFSFYRNAIECYAKKEVCPQ